MQRTVKLPPEADGADAGAGIWLLETELSRNCRASTSQIRATFPQAYCHGHINDVYCCTGTSCPNGRQRDDHEGKGRLRGGVRHCRVRGGPLRSLSSQERFSRSLETLPGMVSANFRARAGCRSVELPRGGAARIGVHRLPRRALRSSFLEALPVGTSRQEADVVVPELTAS